MNAAVIEKADSETGLAVVADLARRVWHEHYPGVISRAQIDYMLVQDYSLPAMRAEIADGVRYRLARLGDEMVGFAAHGPAALETDTLWLHKLYVLADYRRRGVAAALFETAREHAADCARRTIRLRVNRGNRNAVAAYRRLGFMIEGTDVKDIGNGFVMDDYIMRRKADPDQPHGAVATSATL